MENEQFTEANTPESEHSEPTQIKEVEAPVSLAPTNPFMMPTKVVEPEDALPDATLESVHPDIRESMLQSGWSQLMPVQAKTIPYMRAGRDMLIQSKTGSGKTGAFVIPLLEIIEVEHRFPQALILVPTRELAVQVQEEVEKLGAARKIHSVALFGGVGYGSQIKALQDGVHLVVATPGRLLDHLERRNLDFLSLRDLVMDEADEMLSMGFYPDMQRITKYLPKQHCTTMFSATIPQTVRSLAREFQTRNAGFLSLSFKEVGADNLDHRYYVVDGMQKDTVIAQILEYENPESCIIFCNMKKDVTYLHEFLTGFGFRTEALSGDIVQKKREKVLKDFKDKKLDILIATDVAARGIDVSHVSHVIIHDHPDDHEVYIHRAGRTARAGRSGVAISVVSQVEEKELRRTGKDFNIDFIKMPNLEEEQVNDRVRQRTINFLDQGKRQLGQKTKKRLQRYLPLIDQLASVDEEKELLAFLLDEYYWKAQRKEHDEG
jgi:ATP-dependent RNA helicase DeaD